MGASRARSKRRSAASYTSPKPPDIVYFVDRSLGRNVVAAALRGAGATLEVHDDHFPPDAPDVEWLAVAGARRWVVLTKDEKIRQHPIEREALLGAGVRAFVLTARRLRGDEMGRAFLRARRAMEQLVRDRRGAFIARVTKYGRVRVIAAR